MMDLRSQLSFYRKEHDEILRFLMNWENALQLTANPSLEFRFRGLAQLVEMERALLEIRGHCQEEEQSLDSPFQAYLDDRAFERLLQQHQMLDELMNGYDVELRHANARRPTAELVGIGKHLLGELRRHVAFEEGLLKQIEDGSLKHESIDLHDPSLVD